MLLLWFFLLVQELFEEQLGLQQRLRLGSGLGRVQEGHTGVRSGPCGPQGGMPGGLQGHTSSRMLPPSCRYRWLFPAHVLAWHGWRSPPFLPGKKYAEDKPLMAKQEGESGGCA